MAAQEEQPLKSRSNDYHLFLLLTFLGRFDLEPLVECDDEYWETENLPRFVQPTGTPSQITFWNCFLRLVEILGLAQESLVRL